MVRTHVIRLRVIESPNEYCLHTCDVCVITTWRLWATRGARNNGNDIDNDNDDDDDDDDNNNNDNNM